MADYEDYDEDVVDLTIEGEHEADLQKVEERYASIFVDNDEQPTEIAYDLISLDGDKSNDEIVVERVVPPVSKTKTTTSQRRRTAAPATTDNGKKNTKEKPVVAFSKHNNSKFESVANKDTGNEKSWNQQQYGSLAAKTRGIITQEKNKLLDQRNSKRSQRKNISAPATEISTRAVSTVDRKKQAPSGVASQAGSVVSSTKLTRPKEIRQNPKVSCNERISTTEEECERKKMVQQLPKRAGKRKRVSHHQQQELYQRDQSSSSSQQRCQQFAKRRQPKALVESAPQKGERPGDKTTKKPRIHDDDRINSTPIVSDSRRSQETHQRKQEQQQDNPRKSLQTQCVQPIYNSRAAKPCNNHNKQAKHDNERFFTRHDRYRNDNFKESDLDRATSLPVRRHVKTVPIPLDEHHDHSFMGLMMGPFGNKIKELETQTGCEISIRRPGFGDDGRPTSKRRKSDLNGETLYIVVSGEFQGAVMNASSMIEEMRLSQMNDCIDEKKSARESMHFFGRPCMPNKAEQKPASQNGNESRDRQPTSNTTFTNRESFAQHDVSCPGKFPYGGNQDGCMIKAPWDRVGNCRRGQTHQGRDSSPVRNDCQNFKHISPETLSKSRNQIGMEACEKEESCFQGSKKNLRWDLTKEFMFKRHSETMTIPELWKGDCHERVGMLVSNSSRQQENLHDLLDISSDEQTWKGGRTRDARRLSKEDSRVFNNSFRQTTLQRGFTGLQGKVAWPDTRTSETNASGRGQQPMKENFDYGFSSDLVHHQYNRGNRHNIGLYGQNHAGMKFDSEVNGKAIDCTPRQDDRSCWKDEEWKRGESMDTSFSKKRKRKKRKKKHGRRDCMMPDNAMSASLDHQQGSFSLPQHYSKNLVEEPHAARPGRLLSIDTRKDMRGPHTVSMKNLSHIEFGMEVNCERLKQQQMLPSRDQNRISIRSQVAHRRCSSRCFKEMEEVEFSCDGKSHREQDAPKHSRFENFNSNDRRNKSIPTIAERSIPSFEELHRSRYNETHGDNTNDDRIPLPSRCRTDFANSPRNKSVSVPFVKETNVKSVNALIQKTSEESDCDSLWNSEDNILSQTSPSQRNCSNSPTYECSAAPIVKETSLPSPKKPVPDKPCCYGRGNDHERIANLPTPLGITCPNVPSDCCPPVCRLKGVRVPSSKKTNMNRSDESGSDDLWDGDDDNFQSLPSRSHSYFLSSQRHNAATSVNETSIPSPPETSQNRSEGNKRLSDDGATILPTPSEPSTHFSDSLREACIAEASVIQRNVPSVNLPYQNRSDEPDTNMSEDHEDDMLSTPSHTRLDCSISQTDDCPVGSKTSETSLKELSQEIFDPIKSDKYDDRIPLLLSHFRSVGSEAPRDLYQEAPPTKTLNLAAVEDTHIGRYDKGDSAGRCEHSNSIPNLPTDSRTNKSNSPTHDCLKIPRLKENESPSSAPSQNRSDETDSDSLWDDDDFIPLSKLFGQAGFNGFTRKQGCKRVCDQENDRGEPTSSPNSGINDTYESTKQRSGAIDEATLEVRLVTKTGEADTVGRERPNECDGDTTMRANESTLSSEYWSDPLTSTSKRSHSGCQKTKLESDERLDETMLVGIALKHESCTTSSVMSKGRGFRGGRVMKNETAKQQASVDLAASNGYHGCDDSNESVMLENTSGSATQFRKASGTEVQDKRACCSLQDPPNLNIAHGLFTCSALKDIEKDGKISGRSSDQDDGESGKSRDQLCCEHFCHGQTGNKSNNEGSRRTQNSLSQGDPSSSQLRNDTGISLPVPSAKVDEGTFNQSEQKMSGLKSKPESLENSYVRHPEEAFRRPIGASFGVQNSAFVEENKPSKQGHRQEDVAGSSEEGANGSRNNKNEHRSQPKEQQINFIIIDDSSEDEKPNFVPRQYAPKQFSLKKKRSNPIGFNFFVSDEAAADEQERLFRAAAQRMKLREHVTSYPNCVIETTPDITVPVLDIELKYPHHWKWKEPYSRLGLPRNATQRLVKTQFRRLARLYHPDKSFAENAAQKFHGISSAYKAIIK